MHVKLTVSSNLQPIRMTYHTSVRGNTQVLVFLKLRLHDPAYFCENLDLCIFVLFSFIWSDGDFSS